MTNQEFATSLRLIADFYEQNAAFPTPSCDPLYVFAQEKESFLECARMLGTAEKEADGQWFNLNRIFGALTLQLTVRRNAVCERVVVGTRQVPEQMVPARPEEVIPAHEEEIIEWHCPESILSKEAMRGGR